MAGTGQRPSSDASGARLARDGYRPLPGFMDEVYSGDETVRSTSERYRVRRGGHAFRVRASNGVATGPVDRHRFRVVGL